MRIEDSHGGDLMFNTYFGYDNIIPQTTTALPAVAQVTPFKELHRNKDRKKQEKKNVRKSAFKDILKEEAPEEFDGMGCFFETRV